jgi:hypothetical protein
MSTFLTLLLGVFIGAALMIFTLALMAAGREDYEREEREKLEQEQQLRSDTPPNRGSAVQHK